MAHARMWHMTQSSEMLTRAAVRWRNRAQCARVIDAHLIDDLLVGHVDHLHREGRAHDDRYRRPEAVRREVEELEARVRAAVERVDRAAPEEVREREVHA